MDSRATIITLICALLGGVALAGPLQLVVTTSMIESAVRDAYQDEVPLRISRIIPPGNCPGHFDLKPQMLLDIRKADLFVYHSFQRGIEARVKGLDAGVQMVELPATGSYLIPSNYWGSVEMLRKELDQLLEAEDQEEPASPATAEQRMLAECERQNRFWGAAVEENGWKGARVIASVMQADFCRWLGFDVVGILPRSEDLSPARMRALVDSAAALVVGNRQSDAQAAAMLAGRKGIPYAILDNFPPSLAVEGGSMYMRLARKNRRILEAAWKSR